MREEEIQSEIEDAPPPPVMTAPPAEAPPTGTERLTDDYQCRRCGYNLRGLTLDGKCPECMTSVGRSVHGDLLRFCDPGWMQTLANGMRLFVVAIVAGIVVGLGLGGAVGVSVVLGQSVPTVLLITLVVILGSLAVIELIAYWKITEPDPGRCEREKPICARSLSRYCLVFSACASLAVGLITLSQFLPVPAGATPAVTGGLVLMLLRAVVMVAGITGTAALFVYAMSIAERMPDAKLRKNTRTVMWGYLVCTGLLQVVGVVQSSFGISGAPTQPVGLALGCGSIVAFVPGMVFWIWSMVLIFQYRNRLVVAARLARETWAQEG